MHAIQPVLVVRSVEDSIEWYSSVLGLEAEFVNRDASSEPNYAVLKLDDVSIHVGLERDMENPAGMGAFNLTTTRFDEIWRRCRELGISPFIDMTQIPTGQRSFGIKDMDGNLITLVEHGAGE